MTKRILTVLLAFILLIGTTACFGNKNGESTTESEKESISVSLGKTEIDLIKNGKVEYVIVYPENKANDENMKKAISELKTLFWEATDVYLSAYSDAVEFSDYKILSLGKTAQANKQTELIEKVNQEKLGAHGYVIETIGNSVYMLGNGNNALAELYAVYEFLKWQFAFECYAKDEYKIEKTANKKLVDFNLVDIPSFQSRSAYNFEGLTNARLRTQAYEDGFNNVDGNTFCHNLYALIPGEKYYNDHPKWFYQYTGAGQYGQELCLNAQGDEKERQALIDTITEEIKYRFLEDPSVDWTSICQQDTAALCDCSACTKDYALYDRTKLTATYATYIRFINAVAKKIKVWNEEVCPERELVIFLWDYGKVRYAPVKLDANKKPIVDENGNYMPYSDDLILEDNVAVYYCGLHNANIVGLEADAHQDDLEALKRVKAIMKNPLMYFWKQSAPFYDYLMPMHVADTRAEYYKFMIEMGAIGVYDQGYGGEYGPDFATLESYISAKLMWNVNLNVEDLIQDFFLNYYKDASSVMLDLYNEYRAYMKYLEKEFHIVGGTVEMATTLKNEKYWPYMRLKGFSAYIDKAYGTIEKYRNSDPALYEKLYKRIKKESLTFRYLELTLYSNFYDSNTVLSMQQQLKFDCIDCGMTERAEFISIDELFAY